MPTVDRLPERLRRCVDQAVAAEALEGWRPTSDHIDALAALVDDDVTFGDYLSDYLNHNPPAPAPKSIPRMFHRKVPYLIPGTSVLRNNFGARTHAALADLEFVSSAGRIAHLHRRIADGDVSACDVDFRAVHRALFSDVYEWAGEYRVTELRLGDERFAAQSAVEAEMGRVEATARALVAGSPDTLVDQLARLYSEYNYVHPFREGNGRTCTTVLHIVASLRGRRLDLSRISRAEWYAASHASMPRLPDGGADHSSLVGLFERALG